VGTGSHSDAIAELLLWCAVGLVGFLLLALFAVWMRRRTLGQRESGAPNLFDLGTLQRLRDEEAISEHEYKVLRSAAIRALGGGERES